jgi:hypothetical protein
MFGEILNSDDNKPKIFDAIDSWHGLCTIYCTCFVSCEWIEWVNELSNNIQTSKTNIFWLAAFMRDQKSLYGIVL